MWNLLRAHGLAIRTLSTLCRMVSLAQSLTMTTTSPSESPRRATWPRLARQARARRSPGARAPSPCNGLFQVLLGVKELSWRKSYVSAKYALTRAETEVGDM